MEKQRILPQMTGKNLLLGFQHVFAMFGATVLVPLITGLNISTTLFAAGVGTLLFHFVTKGKVPAFLGSSFAFLGGFAIVAHPHNQLDDIDYLMECGIVGLEVYHHDLTEEEQKRALKIALEKGLFISGGSDHYGLCGGCYSSYPTEEELKRSRHYVP